jgi:uncharacterized membrane protein YsdA (DUF1294 family)
MTETLLYYLIVINVTVFLVYGIDKWRAKKGKWRISEATLLLLAVIGGSIGAWLGMKVWHHKTMHKKFKYGVPAILIIQIILIGYCHNTPNVSSFSHAQMEDTQRTITKELAYDGVNNYCHKEYDWSAAKDNPDIMYLTMGEETDSTYQVVFRSYTGAFVHFYVNKTNGITRMVESIPSLNVEEKAGTINLLDYLEKQ